MRPMRMLAAVILVSAAGCAFACSASAEEDALAWSEVQKMHRKAFKKLPLLAHAKLVKEIEPSLPGGVVIEAAPFAGLIRRLLSELSERIAMHSDHLMHTLLVPECA